MDAWKDELKDEWMDAWKDAWKDELKVEWMDASLSRRSFQMAEVGISLHLKDQ